MTKNNGHKPPAIEVRLAALPEEERETVEAMIVSLCELGNGLGRVSALEIIVKAGRWMRRQERAEWLRC